MARAKLAISKQTKEKYVNKLEVPALERATNDTYIVGLDKVVLPEVVPLKIKVSTTFNFAKSINSENKGWFELESIRVNEVSVPSPPRWVKFAACFKARLVAFGWKQRHSIDCVISFASVCRLENQR